MRAIIIEKFGGPENLVIQNLPDPEPAPGNVVIEVKAFGFTTPRHTCERENWPRPQR
jgi:NADPH:quinone reductase-like Zn-dependent oxidoreductase